MAPLSPAPPADQRSLARLVVLVCAAQVLVQEGARARGGALADVVAAAVVADAERRRALLEELSPRVRLREVMEDVSEVLAQLRTRTRPGGLPN